jgi:hypothetical protein
MFSAAEQLGRGRRPEVRGQVRVLDQRPVRPKAAPDAVSIAASQRASEVRSTDGVGVQQRRLQHRGHGQLQVFPGQRGQRVLVGDDLALLGHLDRAVQRAVRLGQDRLVGGPPPRPDRAAAAVEEPQPDAVPGRPRPAAPAAPCGSTTGWW